MPGTHFRGSWNGKRFRKPFVVLAVIAIGFGGDGWESNPPRTPQQRPANGFEDRGPGVRISPPAFIGVRSLALSIRHVPRASVLVHDVGCRVGCHLDDQMTYLGVTLRRWLRGSDGGCSTGDFVVEALEKRIHFTTPSKLDYW